VVVVVPTGVVVVVGLRVLGGAGVVEVGGGGAVETEVRVVGTGPLGTVEELVLAVAEVGGPG